jgi:2-deoxy-D-gluconate 3-dehydrogenase
VAATLDLQSEESVAQASAEVIAALGGLDVLVNNAGVNLRKDATAVTRQEWDAVMNVNLRGTFFLGAPERSIYGISKAALIGMTRMLAVEWAAHNIRVNAIAPGRLVTASPSRAHNKADRSYMEPMLKRIPLHRLASVEEVAAAAAYLASPAAASITGQVLVLDGGLTAS